VLRPGGAVSRTKSERGKETAPQQQCRLCGRVVVVKDTDRDFKLITQCWSLMQVVVCKPEGM
jgi:hypothetical protein